MIELKNYQKWAVEEFVRYLDNLKMYDNDPNHAFVEFHKNREQRKPYTSFKAKAELTYDGIDPAKVCMKVPTGGGKTLLACHFLGMLFEKHLAHRNDTGIVVWFVPNDIIRSQVLAAFRNDDHTYRTTLRQFFPNFIVFDVDEALQMKKSDVRNNLCLIVSTLAAFRRGAKNTRVYFQNGGLLEHFTGIVNDDFLDGERCESLVNVIRINNPVIFIDESHNASTDLSYEMLGHLNPCFIIESTATVKADSNVIVDVPAKRLKDEDMIKLPLHVETTSSGWETALRMGVEKLNRLDELSRDEKKRTGEYIRPIAVIQTEQVKPSESALYVDVVKEHLIKSGISEKEIAIKTADTNELANVDLRSSKCRIRFIFTVNALREGWDEPFPYVLISLSKVSKPLPVEQTIGRIMRMPNQRKKKHEDLNQSYVFTSSDSVRKTADKIMKALNEHGYDQRYMVNSEHPEVNDNKVAEKTSNDWTFCIPCIAINKDGKIRRISFYDDLLGSDFELSKQKIPKYNSYVESNSASIVYDVDNASKITFQTQTTIDQHIATSSPNDLLNWLDRHIRFTSYDSVDKRKFFSMVINNASESIGLDKLYKAKNWFADSIKHNVIQLETSRAKTTFQNLEREKRLILNKKYYEPEDNIHIKNPNMAKFKKHFYTELELMNSEETEFVEKINALDNVLFWYRNTEKRDFYIQGWKKDLFYPDFIIMTNNGCKIIVEYKGAHLKGSEDTQYKQELGETWARLAGGQHRFFMAFKYNMAEIISDISIL